MRWFRRGNERPSIQDISKTGMDHPELSEARRKQFRRPLGIDRHSYPPAPSKEECLEAIEQGLNNRAPRKRKDLVNIVDRWVRDNDSQLDAATRQELAARYNAVHNVWRTAQYIRFVGLSNDFQTAAQNFLEYARGKIRPGEANLGTLKEGNASPTPMAPTKIEPTSAPATRDSVSAEPSPTLLVPFSQSSSEPPFSHDTPQQDREEQQRSPLRTSSRSGGSEASQGSEARQTDHPLPDTGRPMEASSSIGALTGIESIIPSGKADLGADAVLLRIVTATPEITPPRSPTRDSAKLSIGVPGEHSPGTSTNSEFDLSSDSSLYETEKNRDAGAASRRVERLNHKRTEYITRSQKLYDQEFTNAMHIVGTCMSAAKIIGEVVHFVKNIEGSPEFESLLEHFKEKPLIDLAIHYAEIQDNYLRGREEKTWHADLLRNAAKHYESTRDTVLKISNRVVAGRDMNSPFDNPNLYQDASQPIYSPGGMLQSAAQSDIMNPNSALNPVELYERKRHLLMQEINKHNDDNDKYNSEIIPHLKKHKLNRFDYPEKLHAEIPPLPSLNEALGQKIWEQYEKILSTYPLSSEYRYEFIVDELRKGPITWKWDNKRWALGPSE
ncbi:MAG TPA: hypothetical protein VGL94_11260 [Ktedonobacteraceae bacterium]